VRSGQRYPGGLAKTRHSEKTVAPAAGGFFRGLTVSDTVGELVEPARGELSIPRPWRRLPDGRVGYFQRSTRDCFEACVATVLQMPLGVFPKRTPPGPHQWATVEAAAARRGLRPVEHRDALPVDRAIWIGVGHPLIADFRHTVVMRHGEILHDPASGVELPPDYTRLEIGPLAYGVTFDPIDRKESP
jgi:hypothetical protein